MAASFRRIGFVSTRFAGTDGVTFEAGKWAVLLGETGAECFWFGGELETPPERSQLVPEAFFNHPAVLAVQAALFGVTTRSAETTARVEAMAGRLEVALREFIDRFALDLLVVQNALAIPMHVPLGLAITRVIAAQKMPVIAHHHDFFWERERFAVNACADWLDEAFPPRLPGVAHVVINSLQRDALAARFGLAASVVPNVLDFDRPPPEPDDYARTFRAEIGLPDNATFILQPTRIIARKGIEHSVELVRRLADRRAVLVLTHPAGDEGLETLRDIEARIAAAGIPAIFLSGRIGQRRGITPDGRRIYTLEDVYPQADLVTYPSSWEGFGNALVEAVYFGRPMLVNRYPVYVSDIGARGLRAVEMDGAITDEVVAEVRALLDDPARRAAWAAENFAVARRHFSFAEARRRIVALLASLRPGG